MAVDNKIIGEVKKNNNKNRSGLNCKQEGRSKKMMIIERGLTANPGPKGDMGSVRCEMDEKQRSEGTAGEEEQEVEEQEVEGKEVE